MTEDPRRRGRRRDRLTSHSLGTVQRRSFFWRKEWKKTEDPKKRCKKNIFFNIPWLSVFLKNLRLKTVKHLARWCFFFELRGFKEAPVVGFGSLVLPIGLDEEGLQNRKRRFRKTPGRRRLRNRKDRWKGPDPVRKRKKNVLKDG